MVTTREANDEDDELSDRDSPAFHGPRHSVHEQGIQPRKLG